MSYKSDSHLRSTSNDVPFWQDGIPVYNEPRALQAVDTALSYWMSCHIDNVYDYNGYVPPGREYCYSGGDTFLDDGVVNVSDENDDHVWDRGFGAEFALTSGTYMRASIYIARCPGEDYVPYSNADPTVDVWRPKLIKIY